MKVKAWYKNFGHEHVNKFYHINDIQEEKTIHATIYEYHQVFKKVLNKDDDTFNVKWWMEQEISNNIHEIPENTVPFLMRI